MFEKYSNWNKKNTGKNQWRRQWHPTPVLLPGKSHGQRSLVGCSPWGRKELDTTERLHVHFSLSCTGEGNGNPLQCSCLEIPGTGEPGGLPSLGSHRVGHYWSDLAAAAAASVGGTMRDWGNETGKGGRIRSTLHNRMDWDSECHPEW